MLFQPHLVVLPLLAATAAQAKFDFMKKAFGPAPEPYSAAIPHPLPIRGFGFGGTPEFVPPTATDSRSPCPGVNVHDVSLTRSDFNIGNNNAYNKTLWDQALSFIPPGSKTWTPASAVQAHHQRLRDSERDNPGFQYTPLQVLFKFGELAITSQVFGGIDHVLSGPPLDYVNAFFEEERLPYKEGWSPSLVPIDIPTLLPGAAAYAAIAPEPLEEAVQFTYGGIMSILNGGLVSPGIACAFNLKGCVGSPFTPGTVPGTNGLPGHN
ncbi:hypothetical protein RQP46_003755 [Phenoliferia psychrophenolica]